MTHNPNRKDNTVDDLRLFSSEEIAERLSISIRTLWRLLDSGDFPQPDYRPNRKLVRWSATLLRKWLAGKAGCKLEDISLVDMPALAQPPPEKPRRLHIVGADELDEDKTDGDGVRLSRMMTPKSAAAALGVAVSTVRRFIREGKLRAYRRPGGTRLLLSREDVRALALVRLEVPA